MKPAKLSTRPVGGYGDTRGGRPRKRKPENAYGLHKALGILALALAYSLFLIIVL